MLPETGLNFQTNFNIVEPPSFTFYLDRENDVIIGFTDGKEAMRQAIYLILLTERYRFIIFSRNYGSELEELFGQQTSYVVPELKRRIREALTQDTRIQSVDGFSFEINRNAVLVRFTAHTIFGDIDDMIEVSYNI